jgi:uncharacterized protein (DUF849 family)
MAGPFIVMCAPNGARKTKADHPALPITANDIADCAQAIVEAGASIMHVHVRDDEGRHSLDADRYRAATKAIRARVGDHLVVQVTSEACGIYQPEQQMAMVRELLHEAVSLALKEICPDDDAEAVAAAFYSQLADQGMMVQHILYSSSEVARFERLRKSGVIPDKRPFVLFVLGRYSDDLTGNPGELTGFIEAAAKDTEWAVCCFGRTEKEVVTMAATGNGHARVGFENNLLLPDGSVADDNAQLVRGAANAGRNQGRVLATAQDVREMFG